MEEMNMKLIVDSCEIGVLPAGTVLTVESDRTNQFTGCRTLNVKADDGTRHQLYRMPDEHTWTEVQVGLARGHEKVVLSTSGPTLA